MTYPHPQEKSIKVPAYMMGGYFMHTTGEGLQRPTEGADREKRLGNLNGFTGGSFAGMVYNPEYLSPSLTTMGGGGRMPHIVVSYEKLHNRSQPW